MNELCPHSAFSAAGAGAGGMTTRQILILNGPNLNLLGQRQPDIYGNETLGDVEAKCRRVAIELGLTVDFRQSNAEHELISWLHEARESVAGIIINPAGYSHKSVAIMDALAACPCPILEVHISNIHRREPFRQHSYVSHVATGVICGCGTQGYSLALRRLATLLEKVFP